MSDGSAAPTIESVDFLDRANLNVPQPFWRRLREAGPVVPVRPLHPSDLVTLHLVQREDIQYALRHPEIYSSVGLADIGQKRPLIPESIDPPEHTQYRRLLDPMFAPREVAKLEPSITALANQLMDNFQDRGSCDFKEEFAIPLPSTIFLNLVGWPLSDMDVFLEMKNGVLHRHGATLEEEIDNQKAWAAKADEYFETLLAERKRRRGDDLISRLLDSEIDGEKVSDDGILGICFLIMTAGLDTVTNTLCLDLAYFAQHSEARDAIVADPDLIPSAIEELLRWETPVVGTSRVTTTDTEIGGCPVQKGTWVGLAFGAANTDSSLTERADVVDLGRRPNPHFAFGGGVHRCLGSHLARLELRIALREWHRRIPEYSIPAGTELDFAPMLRQINQLPLVFASDRPVPRGDS
jgi:cytochrome P450